MSLLYEHGVIPTPPDIGYVIHPGNRTGYKARRNRITGAVQVQISAYGGKFTVVSRTQKKLFETTPVP